MEAADDLDLAGIGGGFGFVFSAEDGGEREPPSGSGFVGVIPDEFGVEPDRAVGAGIGAGVEFVLDAGLKESVPVPAAPTGCAMGALEILDAAGLADPFPDALTDAVIREEVEESGDATQRVVGRLPDAADVRDE